MEHLRAFVNAVTPIDEQAMQALLDHFEESLFKKNELLNSGVHGAKRLYFIDKGLVKLAFGNDGREFIMRFFSEGQMVTILETLFMDRPAPFYIRALEDTVTLSIGSTELHRLCQQHHSIETFVRKFTTGAAVNMMRRIKEMLEDDATKRYNIFLSDNSKIVNRVSLGDMAAYLGITQVSLSRIRAKE